MKNNKKNKKFILKRYNGFPTLPIDVFIFIMSSFSLKDFGNFRLISKWFKKMFDELIEKSKILSFFSERQLASLKNVKQSFSTSIDNFIIEKIKNKKINLQDELVKMIYEDKIISLEKIEKDWNKLLTPLNCDLYGKKILVKVMNLRFGVYPNEQYFYNKCANGTKNEIELIIAADEYLSDYMPYPLTFLKKGFGYACLNQNDKIILKYLYDKYINVAKGRAQTDRMFGMPSSPIDTKCPHCYIDMEDHFDY